MGRAQNTDKTTQPAAQAAQAAGGRRGSLSPQERTLAEFERLIAPMHRRFTMAGLGKDSQTDQNRAKARAVRNLSVPLQKQLIRIAQECYHIDPATKLPSGIAAEYAGSEDPRLRQQAERARRLGEKAREMFIFSHTGFVMQQMRKQVGAFDSESDETALELLRQEAYLGLNDAIDRYKFCIGKRDLAVDAETGEPVMHPKTGKMYTTPVLDENGEQVMVENEANPLTYAVGRIRHRVGEAKEQGRLIAIKSRAYDDAEKVERTVKQIENDGRVVTLQEISDRTGIPVERAGQLLRAIRQQVRLDSAHHEDGDETVGSVIADKATSIEGQVLGNMERDTVRQVVAALDSPYEQLIIEASFGLGGNEELGQAHLYDGVYLDSEGNRYSAEGPVITERTKRGEDVIRAAQSDLNKRFKNGELVFEAGTPESYKLSQLKKVEELQKRADTLVRQASQVRSEDKAAALVADAEALVRQAHELPAQSDDAARARRLVTAETGVPMTSGQIQDAQVKAFYKLSQSKTLDGLRERYRGDHELENSVTARKLVRRALIAVGDVKDDDAADKVKAGRAAEDGSHKKGRLVQMAQARSWVDARGRMRITEEQVRKLEAARALTETRKAQREDRASSDETDFAAMMQEV